MIIKNRFQTALFTIFTLLSSTFAPYYSFTSCAMAQGVADLPVPGAKVELSRGFIPPLVKGVTVDPQNALRMDFLVDPGESGADIHSQAFEAESRRLIKYFLTALTVPEKDLWVNLSPYEPDRITASAFGQTEMGRDLLAQDYLLKQLTATLMAPESGPGKRFWERMYQTPGFTNEEARRVVDTFHKVWITPDKAIVYDMGSRAAVGTTHLKVILEEDLISGHETARGPSAALMREVLIPVLEKEVNEGATFAPLRQIYQSMVLATWYKRSMKEGLLGRIYLDRNRITGVDADDKDERQKIYEQYLTAFRKGVYNYIKTDIDPTTGEEIPRQYFSGGFVDTAAAVEFVPASANAALGQGAFVEGLPVDNGQVNALARVEVVFADAAQDSKKKDDTMPSNKGPLDFTDHTIRVLTVPGRPVPPDSIRQSDLFRDRTVVVLADTRADLYAGNLIQAMRDNGNKVIRVDPGASGAFADLVKARPYAVVAADKDAETRTLLGFLAAAQGPINVFFYQTLDRETAPGTPEAPAQQVNLSVTGNQDAIGIAVAALNAHQSQLPRPEYQNRTDYKAAMIYASIAAQQQAQLLELTKSSNPYASNFVVARIDRTGKLHAPNVSAKYQVIFDDQTPDPGFEAVRLFKRGSLLISSPHPDDMEIAAPFLVIQALQHGTNVINRIHTTGNSGIQNDDPLFTRAIEAANRPEVESTGRPIEKVIKEKLRTAEAMAAGRAYVTEGVPGTIDVENLKIDTLAGTEKNRAISESFETILTQHKDRFPRNPFVVVLPHPLDGHKTHRETTSRDIAVLEQLAKEHGVEIQLLYYLAPWAGDYNTYLFHDRRETTLTNDQPPLISSILDKSSRVQAILASELTGTFGQAVPVENMGGVQAERFRRTLVAPPSDKDRYILFLEKTRPGKNLISSFSGVRAVLGASVEQGFNRDALLAFSLYAYHYAARKIAQKPEGKNTMQFGIARDPRPSSPAIREAMYRGYTLAGKEAGVDVRITDLGIITTPMAENEVRMHALENGLGLDGLVIITGSHNPIEQNGIKFTTSAEEVPGGVGRGALLAAGSMEELIGTFQEDRLSKDRILAFEKKSEEITVPPENVSPQTEVLIRQHYLKFIRSLFRDQGLEVLNGVKVAVDPNGGAAAGRSAPEGAGHAAWVLQHLGMTVSEINRELGIPQHKIEPSEDSEGLTQMAAVLKKLGALFGVVFDFDADRGTVAPQLDPQTMTALNVAVSLSWMDTYRLSDDREVVVVANDATSLRVEAIARLFSRPGRPVRVRRVETGEVNVLEAMEQERANGHFVPLGVEGPNGGTLFMESTSRDGVVNAILMGLALNDEAVYQTWMNAINSPGGKRQTLTNLVRSLPEPSRRIAMNKERDVPQDPVALKKSIQTAFENSWNAGGTIGKSLRAKYKEYAFRHYESTVEASTITGEGAGGWSLVLEGHDGKKDFLWLRPSRTEPILRWEVDARDGTRLRFLQSLFQKMYHEAVKNVDASQLGGITLDAAMLDLDIQKRSGARPFPLPAPVTTEQDIAGLVPVVLRVSAVSPVMFAASTPEE